MSELASKSGLLSRLAPLRLIGWGSLWDTSCLNLGLQLLAKDWSLLLHRGVWISWRWWEQDTVPDVTCDLKQNPLEILMCSTHQCVANSGELTLSVRKAWHGLIILKRRWIYERAAWLECGHMWCPLCAVWSFLQVVSHIIISILSLGQLYLK